ncbi:Lrp/AsnC ligand binding domain-containing protein [Candidatus Micrarchaeota archaeon]|nr:Lrp/AsnC ligand binding domain-containing protein [Candidatus Micrarchaeota archaeon]
MENTVSVIIGVVTEEKIKTADIVAGIMPISGVSQVWELTGAYDLMVLVKSHSVKQVNDTLEAIRACKGVTETSTYLVLESHQK